MVNTIENTFGYVCFFTAANGINFIAQKAILKHDNQDFLVTLNKEENTITVDDMGSGRTVGYIEHLFDTMQYNSTSRMSNMKTVVNNVKFFMTAEDAANYSELNFKEGFPLYLEVVKLNYVNHLSDLLDGIEENNEDLVILNMDDEDDTIIPIETEVSVIDNIDSEAAAKKAAWEKENQEFISEKIDELKRKLAHKESEKSKKEQDLEKVNAELELIESRIEDLMTSDVESNGYMYYVSHAQGTKVDLPDDIIEKIKKRFPKGNILKFLSLDNYKLHLADSEGNSIAISKLPNNVISSLRSSFDKMDIDVVESTEEMIDLWTNKEWVDICNKLEKLGFESNPEFNKKCGSNSYYHGEDEENGNGDTSIDLGNGISMSGNISEMNDSALDGLPTDVADAIRGSGAKIYGVR